MYPRTSFLWALLMLLGVASVAAAETIRVAIADNQRSVALRSSQGLIVDGTTAHKSTKTLTITSASLGKGPLRIRPRGELIQIDGKAYRGLLEIRRKGNGRLLVVNELDLEDYLKGVIAAEIPSDWQLEALKAQAVASRTYALYQKRTAGRRPYHILATVDSQVYLGKRGEQPRTLRALKETAGDVLRYQGDVIPAFYHASCGGHTEDALGLWGIDAPYLKGVDCDCQEISAYGVWEKRFPLSDVLRALRREGYPVNAIQGVESGMITAGGRVMNVLVRHSGGTTSVPAESLRAELGYSRVPSVFFEPELADREVVFSGRGRGHGVGLCQWGAQEMALRGYDYRAILSHYYPGTTIGRM